MRIKTGLVLLVAIMAAGCARTLPSQQVLAVNPVQFSANEWRVPSQAVVIADASGTTYMARTFPHVKALTQSFVRAMPDGSSRAKVAGNYDATLIGFGGKERIVSPMAPFNRSALSGKADSLRILGDIHGFGGETPFRNVFVEVQQALRGKAGVAAVVIFSDGLADFEHAAMISAKSLVESHAGEVCFHTVHVGDDADGARFLKQVSALTSCGSARTMADVSNASSFMKFAHAVFAGQAAAAKKPVDACAGRIVLRGVEFEFNKAEISGTSSVILDVAVDQLSRCPNIPMDIDGHTDSVGPEDYNMGLGQRRAEAVKSYLVSKGIRAGRLTARSFGESRPVATNDTDEGRQTNRRVELHPKQ
ncbi:MAG: OmpA family protein [Deltaproteobacteria bacterium]|jgi:OOP family OmpA-OmpF porin|nr:OmpA family protein [Deltaproteobacteria bacterium]